MFVLRKPYLALLKFTSEVKSMITLNFSANKNDTGTGWLDFLKNKFLYELGFFDLLGTVIIIESTAVIDEAQKQDARTDVLYETKLDKNVQKERREYKPLAIIYTTIPAQMKDSLKSFIKSSKTVEEAVDLVLLINPKFRSDKKKKELTALARVFATKPDGYHYLVIPC